MDRTTKNIAAFGINNPVFYSDSVKNVSDDEQAFREAVTYDGKLLAYASERIKNIDDIVDKAVTQNGAALLYANQRFRNIRGYILKAIPTFPEIILYLDAKYGDDEEIMRLVARYGGFYILAGSERLRDMDDIAKDAVECSGEAYRFVSERLRDKEDFTLNALKKKGRNLEFASERLRKKSNVVTEAVKSDGTALEFALYIDKPIVLAALAENIDAVKFIPAELKKDLDIAETVAGTAPEKLSFFPFAVKNNCNVAKKAVEVNGMTLGIFSKKIRI